ncbi:hypothetical protein HZH68_010331 [Vespula germanica]|uniref:Uncharacterized protein n=1 Tax=Vespula germanica TaxID=30212 RepID=A0A834N222_VESGE|nr:hypothetical protein HZH68_010331 [Vespula germanica]
MESMLLVNERTVVTPFTSTNTITTTPPALPSLSSSLSGVVITRNASRYIGSVLGPKLHGLRIELAHCLLFTTKVLIVSRRVERHYKNAISGQTAVEEEKEEEEEEEDLNVNAF